MSAIKLDLLAIGAHPDDVELSAGGTLLNAVKAGKTTGILDLTQGELGTRGTVETRKAEAAEAASILKLSARANASLKDGFLRNDEPSIKEVIRFIRRYRPEIVMGPALADRHPDHGNGSRLVREACFLSGLKMIQTEDNGEIQEAWRPKRVYYYIQDQLIMPDFVIDISDVYEQKKLAIQAYGTQFFKPDQKGPQTYISTRDFTDFLEARAREMGHLIGATFGEGFKSDRPVKMGDIFSSI